MKAVFMSSSGSVNQVYSEELRKKLSDELEFADQIKSADILESRKDELRDVEIIFSTWGMLSLTEAQIKTYFPSLKIVFYGAGSVQYFARPFLDCGVKVVSAWAANGVPVAEYTVAQIILANKGYFQRIHRYNNESWSNRGAGGYYQGNYKNKIGIIGAGMIGKMVIKRLSAYNFDICVFDPFLPDEKAAELKVRKESLEYIFSECTVISNHLANNAQTRGMLRAELFASMQKNAVFINTGRGAQVDEAGLIAAMKAEPCRVALLDVTDPEPPKPESELYRLENVFLSPHIAGSIGREVERMGEYMYDEYRAYIEDRPMKYEVSVEMLATMA